MRACKPARENAVHRDGMRTEKPNPSAHDLGRAASLLGSADGGVVHLLLLGVLGDGGLVVGHNLLLGLGPPLLERLEVALPLETHGGDETLDFGGFGGGLAVLLGDLAADDEFADVVGFVEVEEFADAGGTLGAET